MLFSAWQATTQALQPVQAFRSIAIPHACPSYECSFQSETSGGAWPAPWRIVFSGFFAYSAASTSRMSVAVRLSLSLAPTASMAWWSCVQARG